MMASAVSAIARIILRSSLQIKFILRDNCRGVGWNAPLNAGVWHGSDLMSKLFKLHKCLRCSDSDGLDQDRGETTVNHLRDPENRMRHVGSPPKMSTGFASWVDSVNFRLQPASVDIGVWRVRRLDPPVYQKRQLSHARISDCQPV